MRGKFLGHLGALLVVIAWGASFIFTKVLMEDALLSPIEVYVYRFVLAYVIILAITFKKIFANSIKDELQFLLCGVCAGSLYYVLENTALQYTSTGNVSLLSALAPLVTTALMGLVFRVRLGAGMIIGSVIAFVGVICVIFSHGEGLEFNPLGDLLALLSAFAWATYALGVKRLVPVYSSLFITRKLFFYGVLTAAPLMWIGSGENHLAILFSNPAYILNLLFLVVVCSLLAYLIWNYAMKEIGAVATNNYLYAQPLVTMIVAFFTLGEEISLMGYIGCALIIGGLIISDKLKVKRRVHHLRT
ncbi:MAG: DMT family transporter [Muribaculaceae bacterium]|nr:DMT family transporter [Muribaculaceae bacterium]